MGGSSRQPGPGDVIAEDEREARGDDDDDPPGWNDCLTKERNTQVDEMFVQQTQRRKGISNSAQHQTARDWEEPTPGAATALTHAPTPARMFPDVYGHKTTRLRCRCQGGGRGWNAPVTGRRRRDRSRTRLRSTRAPTRQRPGPRERCRRRRHPSRKKSNLRLGGGREWNASTQ